MPIQPPTRPGYCNFLIAYQQEFFNQLTSEEVRTRFVRGHPVRYWFKPSGKRNEVLDRRVYALAALHARPVPWEVLLRAAPTEPPPRPPSPPEGAGPLTLTPTSSLSMPANRFHPGAHGFALYNQWWDLIGVEGLVWAAIILECALLPMCLLADIFSKMECRTPR